MPDSGVLPNEEELCAALVKEEAKPASSISILRRRIQYKPLRNITSGLWFAILYRAVDLEFKRDVERHHSNKARRNAAILKLAACLRSGSEISSRENKSPSKLMSKRMRSGLACWSTILRQPIALAIVDFSRPPSTVELQNTLLGLENYDLNRSTCYPHAFQKILAIIDKTLRRTESLHKYLENALAEVSDLVYCEVQLTGTKRSRVLDHSESFGVLLEVTFNQNTCPQYMVHYDSPILVCVQSGDIHGAQALFQEGLASIFDVDPYNLGLLYYASYYCWRCYGPVKSIEMCRMLIQVGVDMNMVDEIGNTPIHTMTDSALVERCEGSKLTALVNIGLLCNMSSQELVKEHRSSCKPTILHEILLGIYPGKTSLQGHLRSLQRVGSLAEFIDKPDSRGRSALAWAVEYGMVDAAQTLLSFGANPCQLRISHQIHLPLLHLVIAGPPPSSNSGFFQVVKMLLATQIDINARDSEGWSAWHVAASWRSYEILREIMRTHGHCVELDARTNEGATAHELSHDELFYWNLVSNG